MPPLRAAFAAAALTLLTADVQAADPPTRTEVAEALRRATAFMHGKVAERGGYAWVASPDGRLREGEGVCGPGTVWVQPPGTPAVGVAFLDAYAATGDAAHLDAAAATAEALVRGQLRSGGWHYRIELDPSKRGEFVYRDGPRGGREHAPPTPAPGGWDVWKRHLHKNDTTVIDDDTTPAALRFLIRFDAATKFQNNRVHEAVEYALTAVANAQYPVGAWSHTYDHYPTTPPSEAHYPVKRAAYPADWSRTWTKDWTGCYMLNDRITTNVIATFLLAHKVYGDDRYRAAAERGGRFLLLARMPEPQPAWCQQYDRDMKPVWDRKFEPPAITGMESQDVLDALLLLYRHTGNREYLEPLPAALDYLTKCVQPDGRMARYYELRTNRPLYFTRDYKLTHDPADAPTHYNFHPPSRLPAIEAEYRRLLTLKPGEPREKPEGSPRQPAQGRWLAGAGDGPRREREENDPAGRGREVGHVRRQRVDAEPVSGREVGCTKYTAETRPRGVITRSRETTPRGALRAPYFPASWTVR